MSGRRWRAVVVAIGAGGVAAGVGGCNAGQSPPGVPPIGSALETSSVNWTSVGTPLPVGQQLVIVVAPLVNVSHHTVTVERVRMLGRGVGTVVRVVEMKAVVTGVGREVVPAGEFHADPPVIDYIQPSGCHRAVLRPLEGARIAPDVPGKSLDPSQWIRVMVRFEAASPGRLMNTGYDVTYRQAGRLYHQVIPEGWRLTVKRGVPPQPIAEYERSCLRLSSPVPPYG